VRLTGQTGNDHVRHALQDLPQRTRRVRFRADQMQVPLCRMAQHPIPPLGVMRYPHVYSRALTSDNRDTAGNHSISLLLFKIIVCHHTY
jgi:hypothetical protein